jgi:hypothetical protein
MMRKNKNNDPGDIPDTHIHTDKTANLIKAYEKIYRIPEKDRISGKPNQSIDKLRSVYSQALAAIGENSNGYQRVTGFSDEQRVMNRMRGRMISGILKEGDMVVCIPLCPFDAKGKLHVDIEPVAWMEPENNMCGVEKDGSRWIPINYILARIDKHLDGSAFGVAHSELLFLEHEGEALPLFIAQQKQYDGISHSLSVMTDAFMKAGFTKYLAADFQEQPETDVPDEDESQGMGMKM